MRLRRGFGVISKAVMRDPSIGTTAKAVYALLCTYADDDGECYPGVDTLAENLGCTTRTVDAALKDLREHGVVERQRRRDTTARTRLTDATTSFGSEPETLFGSEPDADFVQTRPAVNKTSSKKASPSSTRSKPKSPWPEGWEPDAALIAKTREKCPSVDIRTEFEKFKAYALANDRRLVRWDQGWIQWAIKAEQEGPPRRRPTKRPVSWDQMNHPV